MDPMLPAHHGPGRPMHAHVPHAYRQNALSHPGNLTPALAGYLDPRSQSWFHGQEGQRLSLPPGTLWCERETSPPAPPGQEAQSHGGGGGPLPPGRPQGCGGAPPGHPGPRKKGCEGPGPAPGRGLECTGARSHCPGRGLWTRYSFFWHEVRTWESRDRFSPLLL